MFVLCQFYVDFVVEKHNFSEKFGSDFCLSEKFFRMKKQFRRREIFPHLHVAVHAAGHRKSVVRISTLQILF